MFILPYISVMLSVALQAASPSISVGTQAPQFTATDSLGHMIDLSILTQKGPVVLAFFPKAKTSGCSQEMRAFVQNKQMLAKYAATVLAVSYDSAEKLKDFAEDLHATFSFIPDPDGVLMRLYDTKMPLVTVAKRRTFVIDRNRNIVLIADGSDAIALKGIEQALNSSAGQTR